MICVAILKTTSERVGIPVKPHAFCMAAATTAAYQVPKEPHLGSALLHHTDSRVTEEHFLCLAESRQSANPSPVVGREPRLWRRRRLGEVAPGAPCLLAETLDRAETPA